MTLGEYLRECRTKLKKSEPEVAAELFATGRFDLFKNEQAFIKQISNLEINASGKSLTKRNAKLFNGRLRLWVKAYGADEATLKTLVNQEINLETDALAARPRARNCRRNNLFLVFTVMKGLPDVGQRELEQVMGFVERLDIVPTEEIVRAYALQILKK